MTTSSILSLPIFRSMDVAGVPLGGGLLYSYAGGTLTPQNTYASTDLSSPNTNPVVLDTTGTAVVRLDPTLSYKFVLKDSTATTTYWTVDAYQSNWLTAAAIGALLYPQTPAESAASVTPTAPQWPPFYVERYGADPTGAADSGVAFRRACAVALAAGGGKIYALGALYAFTTWDTVSFYTGAGNLALFCLPGNTELVGGGMFATKLRITSTARSGMYAAGANRTHIIGMRVNQTGQWVHDLQFDWNGIVQQSATDYCYNIRTMSGGCKIERTYCIQAPLTNSFVDSSTVNTGVALGLPVTLRDNWWQDCGPNMSGNGVNVDCSYVYVEADSSVIERNRLYNTANALNNCGGIEAHGSSYAIRGNTVRNCWPAMYVGDPYAVYPVYGGVIEGNYFGFNNAGIELIWKHVGLLISGNYFEGNDGSGFGSTFTDIYTPLNGTTGVVSSSVQTGVIITDNYFDCSLLRTGAARPTTGSISVSINLGYITGLTVVHNTFYAPQVAVSLAGNASGANKDVQIENNNLINVNDFTSSTNGFFLLLADAAAGWATGGVFQDVYVRNNKILRDRSLSVTTTVGIVATQSVKTATYTNVRWENNYLTNVLAGPSGTAASSIITGYSAATYGTTVAIDASLGKQFFIAATNGTAFTISNPTNGDEGTVPSLGQTITVTVSNQSGGALGAITWGINYKMATFTAPANANQRSVTFQYNGSNWYEVSRCASDVPN